jgi:dienelactone hydrolase
MRFMSDKYEEFLERVPGIAGVFLVLSETQSVLLDGSPCRCERCRKASTEDLLERLIRAIHAPLKARGKRLVVRTFGHSLEQERAIANTINRLPRDLNIAVMSKATTNDFYGLDYPDNPAIAAIRGRPVYLEEAFGEYRGKTHIICIPAGYYRERIRNAARHGLEGVVMRLEHNGFPKHTFESPNLFNIHYVSRLWRDPEADPNAIWQAWFEKRYGPEAARWLIPAFRNTERIWEESTNTLGVYVNSAHGNLAPMYHGPYCAMENLSASVFKVTKGIAEWDALGAEFLHPTDETLSRINRQALGTTRLAEASLRLVEQAGPFLSPADREELTRTFRLGFLTAQVFGQMKRMFFLGLKADQSVEGLRAGLIDQARVATTQAFALARSLEGEFGRDPWPLAPDDGRGSPFYDIVVDYWTHCMAGLVGGRPLPKGAWSEGLKVVTPTGRLYRAFLDAARPGAPPTSELDITLDRDAGPVEVDQDRLTLPVGTGRSIACPLPAKAMRAVVPAGVKVRVRISREGDRLVVAASPLPDHERSLLDYQRRHLKQDQELRDGIRTLCDLEVYKAKVRQRFMEILGPWPERTPLNPTITGTLQRDGYRIEKVLIQSRPGFHVTINLYVPTNRRAPMPALLSPLGHAPDGKAHSINDSYQAIFITLAKKGYVVCAYDPLGQAEREPYGAPTGNQHMIQGYQCMPTGRHLCQYFIWDGIRCLDYLETRAEVDRTKIACSGCSGGGALTNYIAALDDRVAVAVPASWIIESIPLTRDNGLHAESWFLGVCDPHGPGTDQTLACIAPRPLLIIGNERDGEFPRSSTKAAYEQIRKLYTAVGLGDRVEYVNVPTPHGYWPAARRELYRFVNRWFGKEAEGVDEPPGNPDRKEDLYCAPGGQVRNLPGAETVYSLNRALMARLREERRERRTRLPGDEYGAVIQQGVRQVTQYQPVEGPVRTSPVEKTSVDGGSRERMSFEYEPGFTALVDLYLPGKASGGTRSVVVMADDVAVGSELAGGLCREGLRILHLHGPVAQVRHEVMSGRPRCGEWARLAVRGAEYLGDAPGLGTKGVVAVGVGPVAVLAVQFAGILEPGQIQAVAAIGGLDSIESLADGVAEMHELQMMLPGALNWFDEADLAASLAPRAVLVADVRDKAGRRVDKQRLDLRYEWARRQCGNMKAANRLEVSAGSVSSGAMASRIASLLATGPASQGRR